MFERIRPAIEKVLRAAQRDRSAPRGLIQLVGAGPGDPELMTLKALRALQRADLILKKELPQPDPGPAAGNLDILPMLLEQIEAHILYYGRI